MGAGPNSPDPAEDLLIGRVVSDRYRIISKLGEGGMGAVYLAEHVLIEKKLALKVMFPDRLRRSDLIARFLQEARSASRIGHENVIDISDFGQSPEGLVFIAMEYLDGLSLAQLLRREDALPWPRACAIAEQICKGLRAAHARGIVHRDVKPENVFLVQREDNPEFVKVLDFGIAKVVGQASGLTQTGMVFGTPEYMAPEQAIGADTDHRVDVYAVGCILYQMLTGRAPFACESFVGVLTRHLTEEPVPPRQLRPDLDIPAEAEEIVLQAMAKKREQRYADMGCMLAALAAATEGRFDGAVRARPTTMSFEPIPEPERPSRLPWVIMAALAVAGVITGVVILRTTGGHPSRIITEPGRIIKRGPAPATVKHPPEQPPAPPLPAVAPALPAPPLPAAAPAPLTPPPVAKQAAPEQVDTPAKPSTPRKPRAARPPAESTSPPPIVDPELKNPF